MKNFIVDILTIDEALDIVFKMFEKFKNPKRVFKNKLKKLNFKIINNTITSNQLEEFIEKCYSYEKEENIIMSGEWSALGKRHFRSKNTLASVIANAKQKNTRAA